jgi:predicted lipid-binding transport protein (Tim44 family)
VSELKLADADFDDMTNEAELTVRFIGEMTSVVRDRAGDVIEGSATDIKRQRDVWTFARKMGTSDPNWTLVATGE